MSHGGGSVMSLACMVASWSVLMSDMTASSSRMDSEVYRAVLYGQIQTDTVKLIGQSPLDKWKY